MSQAVLLSECQVINKIKPLLQVAVPLYFGMYVIRMGHYIQRVPKTLQTFHSVLLKC